VTTSHTTTTRIIIIVDHHYKDHHLYAGWWTSIVDLQQLATQRTEEPDSLSLYHLVNSLPRGRKGEVTLGRPSPQPTAGPGDNRNSHTQVAFEALDLERRSLPFHRHKIYGPSYCRITTVSQKHPTASLG